MNIRKHLILSLGFLFFYKNIDAPHFLFFFFLNDPPPPDISPLPLHDALPISSCGLGDEQLTAVPEREAEGRAAGRRCRNRQRRETIRADRVHIDLAGRLFGHDEPRAIRSRSEEHTSELQSQSNLVCRLLLEKK